MLQKKTAFKLSGRQPGFSTVEAIIILFIVALAAGAGWVVYHHNHKAMTTHVASPKSTTSSNIQNSATSHMATTTTVNIAELGIHITVPNTIKDIVYTTPKRFTLTSGQTGTAVDISTTSLTKLDQGCSDTGNAPPLGSLSKTNGQYPSSVDASQDNASGALVKQYPSYYIAYTSPQAACSSTPNNVTDTAVINDLALFKAALPTVNVIN